MQSNLNLVEAMGHSEPPQIEESLLKKKVRAASGTLNEISILTPNNSSLPSAMKEKFSCLNKFLITSMMIMMVCWLLLILERPLKNMVNIIPREHLFMLQCQSSMLMMEVKSASKNLSSLWLLGHASKIQRKTLNVFSVTLTKKTRDTFLNKIWWTLHKNWRNKWIQSSLKKWLKTVIQMAMAS